MIRVADPKKGSLVKLILSFVAALFAAGLFAVPAAAATDGPVEIDLPNCGSSDCQPCESQCPQPGDVCRLHGREGVLKWVHGHLVCVCVPEETTTTTVPETTTTTMPPTTTTLPTPTTTVLVPGPQGPAGPQGSSGVQTPRPATPVRIAPTFTG